MYAANLSMSGAPFDCTRNCIVYVVSKQNLRECDVNGQAWVGGCELQSHGQAR